ncbi:hypothetical protein KC330_g5308 [Hortaea werneckii]|nr:hypothetical protein KC330_g5308 [Hortaea werneckii]
MTTKQRPILTIGAGLAGLSLAHVLTNHVISNIVFEAATQDRSQGYAISLKRWAYDPLLASLGHLQLKQLTKVVAPDRARGGKGWLDLALRDNASGDILVAPDPGQRDGVVRANREALLDWIANGGDKNLDVRHGHKFRACRRPSGVVTAVFENGAEHTGSLVVAVDGVFSAVRSHLLPHITPEVLPVVHTGSSFRQEFLTFKRIDPTPLSWSGVDAITSCSINTMAYAAGWSKVPSNMSLIYEDRKFEAGQLVGHHVALMLHEADYHPARQVELLLFHRFTLLPFLGPRPTSSTPWFCSRVAPGAGDGTPIGYSWCWSSSGDRPTIRHYLEPLGPLTGTAADPLNDTAPKQLLLQLAKTFPDTQLDALWKFAAHLRPKARSSDARRFNGSSLLLGLEMGAENDRVDVTAGLITKVPEQVDALLRKIIPAAMRDAYGADVSLDALEAARAFIDADPHLVLNGTMAVDCISPTVSRFKFYVMNTSASFDHIAAVMTFGGRKEVDLEHLKELRQLWYRLKGLPDDFPDSAEPPLPATNGVSNGAAVAGNVTGLSFYFDLHPKHVLPDVKMQVDLSRHATTDLAAAEAVASFLESHGQPHYAAAYMNVLHAFVSREELAAERGVHAYFSFSLKPDGLEIKSKLVYPHYSTSEDLSSGATRVLGGNPGQLRLQGTNTYIIGTGSSRILIDNGSGDQQWIDTIADLLQNRHIELQYILLTHWHGDYTGGVQSLVAHDSKLADRIHKHMPDGDQQDISDGQIFAVEGATVRAVFTPGHAVDHMCFLLEEENALFTGDNVLGHGFSVVEDLGVYMRSIDTMAGLQCSTGYPGHGARIDKLPDKMKEYIVHKEFRARQVMSALSRTNRNGMSLTEVARSIYGEVPQEMIEKVLLPFLTQMMWNLAEDRIVGFAPGDPRMRKWFARPPIRRLHTV